MMRLIAGLSVVLVSVAGPLWGADERELAEELMLLMNVEQGLEQMRPQIESMTSNLFENMDIPEESRSQFRDHQRSTMDLVLDRLSWPKMKDKYVDIYLDVFDAHELEGLIEFYSSPIGKTFISKMPLLTQRSMAMSQEVVMELLPQIQADAERLARELAKQRDVAAEE